MKKNVLLSIIGVLLVLGIGVSFAYFVSQTLISGDGASVTAEPGDMIKVTYDAGSTPLSGNNLMPGDSTSKDFIVTVTPTETEKEATYAIFLNITENTFVKCDDTNYNDLTNMCTKDAQELTYTIKDKDSGSTLASGDLTGVTGKVKLLTETKTVDTQTIFNYTITITFNDTGADQNHNQNKTFNGDVEVEFSEKLLKDEILANNALQTGTPDFSKTAQAVCDGIENCEETNGLYQMKDNDGMSYYFRGAVENNYVQFAGFYWRIIRVNGDESIRIIYDGTNIHVNGEASEDRHIGTSNYNNLRNQSYYVGYTFEENFQRPNSQNSGTASSIKKTLDDWYLINIVTQGLDNKVDSNSGFCNDREMASGYSWVASERELNYAAYERLEMNKTPSLICNHINDLYTTKIGLITADEVTIAGAPVGSINDKYFLYTGNYYWTITPFNYILGSDWGIRMFNVGSGGGLSNAWGYNINYVRPVINLKANVTISSGDGTALNPYVI